MHHHFSLKKKCSRMMTNLLGPEIKHLISKSCLMLEISHVTSRSCSNDFQVFNDFKEPVTYCQDRVGRHPEENRKNNPAHYLRRLKDKCRKSRIINR